MRRMMLVLATLLPAAAFAQSAPTAGTGSTAAPAGSMQQRFVQRFEAANTTHDGHLTLAQAQAAGMKGIVKHFSEIDTAKAGYVTLPEIQSWYMARHAQKAAAQTAS